ncbi:hypothetical protein [Bradyrhizobium sp. USDA 3315]
MMVLVSAGIAMTAFHTLARPHVLVFPLMVLWANALVEASEARRAPSLWYVLLITLWANLHGSFTLGLALIGPFALEALWTADKSARVTVALQWLRFGALALAAACITPYGPESILVTFRLLGLGATLATVGEWKPALEFGALNPIVICLIAGIGYVMYSGFKLPSDQAARAARRHLADPCPRALCRRLRAGCAVLHCRSLGPAPRMASARPKGHPPDEEGVHRSDGRPRDRERRDPGDEGSFAAACAAFRGANAQGAPGEPRIE